MSVAEIDWVYDRPKKRVPPLQLPFNGMLSDDERRLMAQGFGRRGTNFDVLLREQALRAEEV